MKQKLHITGITLIILSIVLILSSVLIPSTFYFKNYDYFYRSDKYNCSIFRVTPPIIKGGRYCYSCHYNNSKINTYRHCIGCSHNNCYDYRVGKIVNIIISYPINNRVNIFLIIIGIGSLASCLVIINIWYYVYNVNRIIRNIPIGFYTHLDITGK
jgi:hypothetical protein